MGGVDTARGMCFQTACALLQLIRAPEQFPEADTFRVEGVDEAIDFEVRNAQGQPLLLAQAKTRVEPGSWSGPDLVRLARRWGEADPGGTAVLRFLSDAPVNASGTAVKDAAARARAVHNAQQWLAGCAELQSSIPLTVEDHALLRRLELHTRSGPWEQILDQARLELLRLSPVAMAANEVDSTVDALFVKLFQWSGDRRLDRRTVRLDELPGLLRGRRAAPAAPASERPGPGRALFRDLPSAAGVRGRERELTALLERFAGETDTGAIRVVMSGLGGIGKSSIAMLYAHRHRGNYEFVWWIPSDTRENVLAAYRRLVAEEQQEVEPATEEEIVTQVKIRLGHLGARALLVYDNVADRSQLHELLPTYDGAHVLITTRDSAWAASDGGLVVPAMASEEAVSWAEEVLPGLARTEISSLVDAMERIPLGIAQATGYIAATQCPVDVYLTELTTCRARLLDDPVFVPFDYREGATLTAAVTLSVGRVIAHALQAEEGSCRQLAGEVLARCALLAPDFIPFHLATLGLPAGSSTYGAVAELRRFSLVDPRGGTLVIHRIVQEVVRTMLDGEAVQHMHEGFQYELVKRLVECQKHPAWTEAATLIEHAVHVAHHVDRSGHANSGTVALLANVAGAISNIHGDLVRTERLLRKALEIVDGATEGALDDAVYRKAATTTALAHCLLNQLRFNEAAEAAHVASDLLEGMDALDAEAVEHLLLVHVAHLRVAVATGGFADVARANARLEVAIRRENPAPAFVLGIRLEQVQSLVWSKDWEVAAVTIEQTKTMAPEWAETNTQLHFLNAMVKASTGRLEEALAVTSRIPEPADSTAVTLVRVHADNMVDVAHALMTGAVCRQDEGAVTDPWVMHAVESMIDRAEALLGTHTAAGPDIMAHVVHRRALLARTRQLLGHPGGDPDLCRTLMRECLNLFEAADQAHAPLAVTARKYLEAGEQGPPGEPDVAVSEDGPTRISPPLSGSGGDYRISDYSWHEAVSLTRRAPEDARVLYSLVGATSYHLGEQKAPSPVFLTLAFTTALRSLGLKSQLVPTLLVVTGNDDEPLDLPDWLLPPLVTQNSEVWGYATVWCEAAGRLVDPALLLGQSRFAPDSVERKAFGSIPVFPSPGLDALVTIEPSMRREGHWLAYRFRPEWREQLHACLKHLDSKAVTEFARTLAASSASLITNADPHTE